MSASVGPPREARQTLELRGHFGQPDDIALERLAETRVLGIFLAGRQEASEHLEDAKRLANLVADQPAEIAKLGGLPVDGLRVARDERIDRLLLQHSHGRMRAAQHQDRCRGIAPLAEPRRLPGEKALENLAEDLILAEQLVDRCALVEAQQTELGRFAHHTRIRGDFLVGWRPKVRRYLLEQLGNVVEKLMRREDLTLLDVK